MTKPTPESKIYAMHPNREQVLGNLSTVLLSWGMANEPGKSKRGAQVATERAVAAVYRASERLAEGAKEKP